MPLKIYNTEAEVPTEHKGFYAANASGKWEPQIEGVQSVSGLVAKRDELLGKVSGHDSELSAKESEIERLTGELTNARSTSLPRGHKAVPNADAELLEKVKPLGTFEEIKAKLDEHGTLKSKVTEQETRDFLATAANVVGWNPEVLYRMPNRPEIEMRDATVEGKAVKLPHAKVKNGEEVSFKPLTEFVEQSPEHNVFLPSLVVKKQPDGTPVPDHGAGGGAATDKPLSDMTMEGWGPKAAAA